MSHSKRKEQNQFYLLAGQGGRASRRKQKFFLTWSIIVGLMVAAVLAGLMYLLNRVSSG